VLSDDTCNARKGMLLAAEEHLQRWSERNIRYANEITDHCCRGSIRADLEASIQIARWTYGQAFSAGSMAWVRGKELRQLGIDWQRAL
jgi:hypothetical protein